MGVTLRNLFVRIIAEFLWYDRKCIHLVYLAEFYTFGFAVKTVEKTQTYFSLKWKYHLDVVERKHEEIQFRKFKPDKEVLQGKFMLSEGPQADETILKFAVEMKAPLEPGEMQILEHPFER